MNRKLLIVDAVLAAVLIYAGAQFYGHWRATRAHELDVLNRRVRPYPPPPYDRAPQPPPVMASSYATIAQRMLLDKSRNPDVVIEVAPPPPPPPMPDLPVYKGVMNLGDGITAIMKPGKNDAEKEVRPGENIGQFKLVSVNMNEVVLEWNGQVIHKTPRELEDHDEGGRSEPPKQAAAAAPAPQPQLQAPAKQIGPLGEGANGERRCDPRDAYPDGAEVNGFRKASRQTPFGLQCWWAPVGK